MTSLEFATAVYFPKGEQAPTGISLMYQALVVQFAEGLLTFWLGSTDNKERTLRGRTAVFSPNLYPYAAGNGKNPLSELPKDLLGILARRTPEQQQELYVASYTATNAKFRHRYKTDPDFGDLVNLKQRVYNAKNADKVNARQHEKRALDPQPNRDWQKQWRVKNPDKVATINVRKNIKCHEEKDIKNPIRTVQRREHHAEHKDDINARRRELYPQNGQSDAHKVYLGNWAVENKDRRNAHRRPRPTSTPPYATHSAHHTRAPTLLFCQ